MKKCKKHSVVVDRPNFKISVTMEDESDLTWDELFYGFYHCLKGFGYSFSKEKEDLMEQEFFPEY